VSFVTRQLPGGHEDCAAGLSCIESSFENKKWKMVGWKDFIAGITFKFEKLVRV
jgi:hypothetical protein